MRKLTIVWLTLLLVTPALAQKSLASLEELASSYQVSPSDVQALSASLEAAGLALAPYREKALPAGMPMPKEVGQALDQMESLAAEHHFRASDGLRFLQVWMLELSDPSRGLTQAKLDQAFGPLGRLLDDHGVSAGQALGFTRPQFEVGLEQRLRMDPESRLQPPSSQRRDEAFARARQFASQHGIGMGQLVVALSNLRSLRN